MGSGEKRRSQHAASTAQMTGANIISSSSDYKRISDELDKEFNDMKAGAIDRRSVGTKEELEKFRDRDNDGMIRSTNDRLAERLFNELYYRQENEDRAKTEIENMRKTIQNIERNLASARELQLKRELGDLLVERETLAELERELCQDISRFKDMYERRKREAYSSRRSQSPSESEEETKRLRELKKRKEQIDSERHRLKSNLDKAGRSDWRGIDRNPTNLLKEAQANKARSLIMNPKPYDITTLNSKIHEGTEKVKNLRRDREELLQYGALNKDNDKRTSQEELAESMRRYLLELQNTPMPAHERADKMQRFRDKLSRLINEEGKIEGENQKKASDLLEELNRKHRFAQSQDNSLRSSPRNELSSFANKSTFSSPNKKILDPDFPELSNLIPHKQITDEAMMLNQYRAQEKEIKRALDFYSTESPEYREKLLQLLQVGEIIGELEKIVEEQKLQRDWEWERNNPDEIKANEAKMKKEIAARIRRNVFGEQADNVHQDDNMKLNEVEMKQAIAQRLRNQAFGSPALKGYDRNVGFDILFDWAIGLSRKFESCQIVYAVYNRGEMIASPRLVAPQKCNMAQSFTNQCVWNVPYTVFDVPSHVDALAIFEFQGLFDQVIQKDTKPETIGWTLIDLFDMMKMLKKGKWRVPVYFKPTNVNITNDKIGKLKRVKDLWFYLRISLPQDKDVANDERKPVEALMQEYHVPQIHTRFWNETNPPLDDHQKEKENLKYEIDMRNILQSQHLPKEAKKNKDLEHKDLFKELFEEEKGDNNDDYDKDENRPFNLMEELAKAEKEEMILSPFKSKPLDISIDFDFSKGLKITIVGLRGFTFDKKFKVTGGLMDGDEFILDENARDCVFGTKSKTLNDLFLYRQSKIESKTLGLNNTNEESEELEETVAFNEEFYFLRDLPGLMIMKQNNLDILLVLQVVGIDYTAQPKQKSAKQKFIDALENFDDDDDEEGEFRKGMEDSYDFLSWYVVKLNLPNGKLNRGRFIEPLYFPPMVKPPFNEKNMMKTGSKIEFVVEEYSYDAAVLRKHKKEQAAKKTENIPKPKLKENPVDIPKQVPKDTPPKGILKGPLIHVAYNKPYIENKTKQYVEKRFERGMGIDFYIDAARFLPDNVTITKVTFSVISQDGFVVVKPQHGLPELDSQSYSPTFKVKIELRSDNFNPTSIALISIETVDQSNGQVRTIGYSAINLFLELRAKVVPTSEAEYNKVLGIFPDGRMLSASNLLSRAQFIKTIHLGQNVLISLFNFGYMARAKLDKIPCSSILVRTIMAPLAFDGYRVLSKDTVPESDWERLGVVIPAPSYGNYNTELFRVTELEKELFSVRQRRDDQAIRKRALELMDPQGFKRDFPDAEVLKWINDKLMKSNATEIIDMIYFAKYLPEYGFKISIDGFHNIPDKIPYVCLSCLNPPGALYQPKPDYEKVFMNSLYDWDSPITSPQFLESFFKFTDISAKPNLTFMIEVRSVSFSKKDVPIFKTIGWTLLPIFNSEGYVQTGIYQLPIFKGSIQKELLDHITHNEAWTYLMDLLGTKKSPIQILEPMSAIVRLVDGQREGHFQTPFDYGRMSIKYLPPLKSHLYIYNAAVEAKLKGKKKLVSIVPSKVDPEQYNKKINEAVTASLK